MAFLAPYFLIGLGALLVPIIIHLWSKNAKQSVSFGSLRFIKETETKTMRSVMPSQWLLLLTRLLLLTLLVFVLAEFRMVSKENPIERLYVVDRIYEDSELLSNLIDSVGEEVEIRWLAEGFPAIDQKPDSSTNDYWQLLSQLPASRANCLVVISPLYVKNFQGEGRTFPEVCQWIQPPLETVEAELISFEKGGEKKIIHASYDEWFITMEIERGGNGKPISVSYSLKSDEKHQEQREIFLAALDAVQKVSFLTLDETSQEEADWVIWLSDDPRPVGKKLIYLDGNTIVAWNQISGSSIAVSANLKKEEAIKIELPRKLVDVFSQDLLDQQLLDVRTIDLASFDYKISEEIDETAYADMSHYLWLALMLVLLLERWLSYKSNKA
ncbi:MAG: BatA domain-containing protein [Ekhidna sp.]|uniref:BatA domain-containing protein n=1 Tax=Ekhidna sp. TaxID=2608089 RepID=UPI0032EFA828